MDLNKRFDYHNVVHNDKINSTAFKHDRFINIIDEGNTLRYKGEDYKLIGTRLKELPLYSHVVYQLDDVDLQPKHIHNLSIEHNIAKLFGCNLHIHTDIHQRLLPNWTGVCDYDKQLGALDETKLNLDDYNILMTGEYLDNDQKRIIRERYENKNLQTVTVVISLLDFGCYRDAMIQIDDAVWVLLPSDLRQHTNTLATFFEEYGVIEIARKCYYDEDNNFKVPLNNIIFKILPYFGLELDTIIYPYDDDFFNKYITSLSYDISKQDITELRKIATACFVRST